jgi:2-polyprenyl-3-methyl-5-hydroxy-6-metoxy-1,4-benzoquinol methylase
MRRVGGKRVAADRETAEAVARRNEYVLTKDWSGEQERLSLLEATVDGFSISAIRAAGFSRACRCLEVGAGSGSIARWFAHETGDPRLVTATDIDPRWLKPLADEGIRVLQHNVLTDDFPPGSFDVIHARCVFEHLAQREEVLDRIVPWLAPDGALVIVDCASFTIDSSPNTVYRKALQAWVDVIAMTGTDYEWTRTFPQPLQRHGYRNVGAFAMAPALQGGTPIAKFWIMTLQTLRDRILDAKLISADEINQAQQLLADPQFWDIGPGFLAAWGRCPQ